MSTTRRCPRCGIERELADFVPDRSKASGYASRCKSCDRAKGKAYYAENREARLEAARERNGSKPIRIADCKHCGCGFARINPSSATVCDECRISRRREAQRLRDQRKDPERERARVRRWKANNRDHIRAYERRRRLVLAAEALACWQATATPPLLNAGPGEVRICGHCDEPFAPTHGSQRYCTTEHKKAAAATRKPSLALTAGYCRECTEPFVAIGSAGDTYCCKTHQKRSERRRDKSVRDKRIRAGANAEMVRHEVVAIRDGWRCHICKRKVTRAAWSIDHLVPLSDGGDHTYANVALAHTLCNARRGARGAAQLLLVA